MKPSIRQRLEQLADRLAELDALLGSEDATRGVVLQAGEQRFCLLVDRVVGREEVVIKALPRSLRGLPGYAGASLVGDGRMAMILDVDALLDSAQRSSSATARGR